MTLSERAQQIWQVLIAAAHDRRLVLRTQLADLIGAEQAVVEQALRLVAEYASKSGLPSLPILVVDERTGEQVIRPAPVHAPAEREATFRFHWFALPPVQAQAFASSLADRVPPEIRKRSRSSYSSKERSNFGAALNEEWEVGAAHALYHKDGHWYHQLRRFPGALFDPDGYILFATEADFQASPYLRVEQDVNVIGTIRDIPGYVRVRT